MIGSVVAVFGMVAGIGVAGLIVAARLRSDMSYSTYRRMVGVSTFAVFVGLFGVLVGGMFWVAS